MENISSPSYFLWLDHCFCKGRQLCVCLVGLCEDLLILHGVISWTTNVVWNVYVVCSEPRLQRGHSLKYPGFIAFLSLNFLSLVMPDFSWPLHWLRWPHNGVDSQFLKLCKKRNKRVHCSNLLLKIGLQTEGAPKSVQSLSSAVLSAPLH